MRQILPLALGPLTALAALTACPVTVTNPDHCGNNDGDEYCKREFGDEKPFCADGSDPECSNDKYGCRAEQPPTGCWDPCGATECTAGTDTDTSDTEPTAGSSTSMTTTTDGTDTSTTETSTTEPTTSSTTTSLPCDSDQDCLDDDDAPGPFCEAEGCVACNNTGEDQAAWDETCATRASIDTPICAGTTCAACSELSPDACPDQTPICDTANNSCLACTSHDQCPDSACHLDPSSDETGACFLPDDVQPAATAGILTGILNGAADGDDIVIDLSGSNYAISGPLSLGVNAEVAIIGSGTQRIQGDNLNGLIQTGGTSILYIDGVNVGSNDGGDGLNCSGTALWLDNSTVSGASAVGLDIASGCQAHVRGSEVVGSPGNDAISIDGNTSSLELINSFTSGGGDGVAIDASGAAVDILYSTVGAGLGTTTAVRCAVGASATIRNSIIVSRGEDPDAISCADLSVDFSALETDQAGQGNVNVGNVSTTWFTSYISGDFHLENGHPFDDIAMWEDGDPAVDIDGQARTETDGDMEPAGADLP